MPVSDPPRLFVSPRQAALMLSLSKPMIYVMIARGQLRAHRFGQRLLIPIAEIESFAAQLAAS